MRWVRTRFTTALPAPTSPTWFGYCTNGWTSTATSTDLSMAAAVGLQTALPAAHEALSRSEVVTEASQNCFEVAPPQFAAAAAWVYSLGMDDST